jgi:integrative and conjugative element protein (TIGR02256 family)
MISIKFEDFSIIIYKNVLEAIKKYRQLNLNDMESGGMLIGSITKDEKIVVINDMTFPLKEDIQNRYKFVRSTKHNQLLKEKWLKSEKTLMYLGEWHTHPQDNPEYSSQDYKNWKRLLRDSFTYIDYLIFIIAGRKTYKIWIGSRVNNTIAHVHIGVF